MRSTQMLHLHGLSPRQFVLPCTGYAQAIEEPVSALTNWDGFAKPGRGGGPRD